MTKRNVFHDATEKAERDALWAAQLKGDDRALTLQLIITFSIAFLGVLGILCSIGLIFHKCC